MILISIKARYAFLTAVFITNSNSFSFLLKASQKNSSMIEAIVQNCESLMAAHFCPNRRKI